jgi:hypothetical protein
MSNYLIAAPHAKLFYLLFTSDCGYRPDSCRSQRRQRRGSAGDVIFSSNRANSRDAGFHEKAGQVKVHFGRFSKKLIADQREVRRCRGPSLLHHRRIATLPSALFVERLLRCQLVSSQL